MIALISGAKKNVGDYLIVDRTKKLLTEFVDADVMEVSRFDNVEKQLDTLNKSDVIILGGGPAYTATVFPDVYKFIAEYDRITPPIVPMGLGWSGVHADDISKFRFSEKSQQYLTKIHSRIKFSSCRDVLTEKILHHHGVRNVLMTGCPVWYDTRQIGKRYQYKKIKRIVITTGASQRLIGQTLDLVKMIRRFFPEAEIILSYHRGIIPGKDTPPRKGLSYSLIALLAQRFNVRVRDVSGEVSKLDFYKDCDFHIGYRVHAHLFFLSQRTPSILINEDGRGLGMGASLGLPVFDMHDRNVVVGVKKQMDDYLREEFSSINTTFTFMDSKFEVMKEFLSSIKKG